MPAEYDILTQLINAAPWGGVIVVLAYIWTKYQKSRDTLFADTLKEIATTWQEHSASLGDQYNEAIKDNNKHIDASTEVSREMLISIGEMKQLLRKANGHFQANPGG